MFSLCALGTGRLLGVAVVCGEARYCSVLPVGENLIHRRFVAATDWPQFLWDLDNLDPGPLAAWTVLARVLCGEDAPSITVQYLAKPPVTADPADVATVLDGLLRAAALGER